MLVIQGGNELLPFKIYVEDDSELAHFEALNKGHRLDVYVEIGQYTYQLAVHDIVRLQQDFQSEYENCGYYEVYPNLIIVKEVSMDEIEKTVFHLYESQFFERLKPIHK